MGGEVPAQWCDAQSLQPGLWKGSKWWRRTRMEVTSLFLRDREIWTGLLDRWQV
ncbi:hypothetical protein L345_13539, partial [Ophiophagus hannah]